MTVLEPETPVPPLAAIDSLVTGDAAGSGPTQGSIPGRARSERILRVLAYTAMIVVSLIYFVPFLWTVSTSLKTLPETAYFSLVPHHWKVQAYQDVWTKYDFARYI
jgi:ABC-type maltose transport system permease subunit